MKKMMLITLALMGSVLCGAKENVTTEENTIFTCTGDPQCVVVGNVAMNVERTGGTVTFINYNNYPVNVTWTALGTVKEGPDKGKEVSCGGGVVYLQPNKKNGYIVTRSFDNDPALGGYRVEGTTQRCD